MSRKQSTPYPYKQGDVVIRPAPPPSPPKPSVGCCRCANCGWQHSKSNEAAIPQATIPPAPPPTRLVTDDDSLARKIRAENREKNPNWLQKLFARFN